MASYFELKQKLSQGGSQTTGSTGKTKSSYFDLKKKVLPVIESSVARLTAENERKKKEEQIKKSQEEAQRYQSEAGTGALIGNTLKGINPFSIQGLKNIGQGVVNVGSAIINPIDTAKKIGGAVKDLATSSAQETAYDVFYQKGLDEQNLKTIQENNKKVLDLNEAIKNTQDEAEKEKLKRHAKIYLEFNQRLAEETGGELKDKTNLQLAGQALGTAMDLTPFLGFGSLGTKLGLKTLEKVGVKSAGKVLGRTLPKTGRELTKEAIIEGGLYGGLSGFGAGIEQKDPTLKSVGLSTAMGTGLGAGGGGVLSTIFSRLGSKAPRLKKAIDEGKIDELEIEKIFEEDGIAGVEEVIKPEPRKLKAGEFAPISKEIQETTGKKLTAKETLEVKDKIEQGYTKEEIIDEIINPRRTEPTPKEVKSVVIAEKEKSSFEQTRDAAIKRAKEQDVRTQSNGKYSKGTAMEFAGIKRKIEGNPTYKEAEKAKKYLESNHQGKEVVVNGVKGKIEKMSFGRVGVKFGDGTIKFFDKDLVKSEKVTKSNVLDYLKKEGERNLDLYKRLYDIKDTPKRTELTSKPLKEESKVNVPDERQEALDYVKSKSVKFREPTAAGDNIIRHARELKDRMAQMVEDGVSENSPQFKQTLKAYEDALDQAQIERTKYRLADEGDDLVSQAKKMKSEGKSFDEFVKAQGTPVYRGEYTRKQTVSDSVSTSLDRRVAESFAEKGNVSEMIVDKNAKIVDLSDLRKEILGVNKLPDPSTLTKEQFEAITGNKLINYAKSKGYDVIDKSKAGIKSSGIKAGDVLDEQEFQVLNKDVLKTKSQLTDIWNKDNKATPKQSLIQEAKKYNSAEELRELGGGKLNEKFREIGVRYQSDYDKWWKENMGDKVTDSYQMSHRPTRTGATADNVSQEVSDMGLPDFYEHPEYYHFGGKEYDESVQALRKIKGKPDAEITIYRASPKGELRSGDWVTLSKEKARLESLTEKTSVHSFKVKVKDVEFAGDDITEFGYWGKSISQEKFRVKDDLAKVGIKITDDQEKQIIKLNKSMFGDENIKITEQILTPQGQKALGSYRDGLIKIVKGEADIKDTYYHESFHKYLDVLTTADEQADLLIEARKVSGLKDFGEVEEWLSEKFIGYAKNREGVTGKIKAQFDNVLERIKTYLGNEDKIKKAYSELISGKATKKVTSTATPTTKTTVKSGESITAKKLNERFKDNKKLSTEYDVIEINKKLDEASRKLQENPEKTISEAFTDGGSNVDKVATLTELFEKSINDGDDFMQNQAFNRLKQLAPETAQTMNMFKALTEANPHFSYMSSVVDEKLKNLILKSSSLRKATKGMKPSEALNKAKKLAKNKIAKDIMRTKSKITIKKAQDLLDSLICK